MKKKKFALLAAFGLFMVGTIGSAAFLFDPATKTIPASPADTAVVLAFGDTTNLTSVDNLTPGSPQFREVIIKKPKVSTGLMEIPTLVISYEDGEAGVSIAIAASTWNAAEAPSVIKTLTSVDTPQEIVPVFGSEVSELTYYLKVSVTQGAYDTLMAAETYTLGLIKIEYLAKVAG